MEFIGRKKELDDLKYIYNQQGQKNILIYGKRRIGKTQLVLESIANFNGIVIFFQALQSSINVNIDLLNEAIGLALNKPFLHLKSINEIIRFLFEESKEKNLILILDEYQFLKKCSPEVDGLFQFYIDHNKLNNLKIVFCGSYAGMMKDLDNLHSPLYGRFNLHMVLQELPYYEAIQLCPNNFSIEDKIKIYSIFSGVPYYYNCLDPNLSCDENIVKNILNINSSLAKECEYILKNELLQINLANDVFHAIASGIKNFQDIKNSLKISNPNSLNYSLKQLIEMQLIEKKETIDGTGKKYYSISDNFYAFYYKYIYHNLSKPIIFQPKKLYESIKDDFETKYVPFTFEKIAKQYVLLLNDKDYFNCILMNVGSFLYNNPQTKKSAEFDIVCEGNNKNFIFFEIKFSKNKTTISDIFHFQNQVNLINLKNKQYGFISKSGFDSESLKYMKDNNWYYFDLNDVMLLNKK